MKYLASAFILGLAILIQACSPAAQTAPATPSPVPQLVPGPTETGTTAPVQALATSPATVAPSSAITVPTSAIAVPSSTPAAAAAPTNQANESKLIVTSSAFSEGASIPNKYSCNGENIAPPLQWSGAPSQTQSYVLIVQDPDAPIGTFYHWVAYNIPPSQTQIPEGAQKVGTSGNNSTGKAGYLGPCPPSGTHRYIFNLYALDVPALSLSEGATQDQVQNAMQGHILAQGKVMGRYGK